MFLKNEIPTLFYFVRVWAVSQQHVYGMTTFLCLIVISRPYFLDEAASWLFERAKKRDAKRKENKKSDWLFERASSRKRFHNLLTESEWYNRRLYNKYCDDGDCSTIDQVSHRILYHPWR